MAPKTHESLASQLKRGLFTKFVFLSILAFVTTILTNTLDPVVAISPPPPPSSPPPFPPPSASPPPPASPPPSPPPAPPPPSPPPASPISGVEMIVDIANLALLDFNATSFSQGLIAGMDNELVYITEISVSTISNINMRRRMSSNRRSLLSYPPATLFTRVDTLMQTTNEATAGIISKYFTSRVTSGQLTTDLSTAMSVIYSDNGTAISTINILGIGIPKMQIVSPAGILEISSSQLPSGSVTGTGVRVSPSTDFTSVGDTNNKTCSLFPHPLLLNLLPMVINESNSTVNATVGQGNSTVTSLPPPPSPPPPSPPPPPPLTSASDVCFFLNFSISDPMVTLSQSTLTSALPLPPVVFFGFGDDEIHGLEYEEWFGIMCGVFALVMVVFVFICGKPRGVKQDIDEINGGTVFGMGTADEFYTMNPLHNAIQL